MAMRIVPEHPRSCFNTMSASVIRFLEEGEAVQTGCLYEHQVDAVLAVRNHLHDPSKPKIALVVLPTGCGKTGVAVLAPYALSASRVLVITPSVIISKQIHEAFVGSEERDCFLIERGIIDREDKDQYCCLPSAACITLAKQIRPHLRDNLMIVNAHKVGGKSSVSIHEIPPNAYDLVIVDEAHHYPAQTWKLLVDHFQSRNRLFLTATPEHCGKYILPDLSDHIAYRISHENAVERGIIRPIDFKDHVDSRWDMTVEQAVAAMVEKCLNDHNEEDPHVHHKAMVLTQTRDAINAASSFKEAYEEVAPNSRCELYVSGTKSQVLDDFKADKIRTLVVIGRLLEGFDDKHVSVVAIVRNVAPTSRVLFAQFIGRAVRKIDCNDPITAMVISHPVFDQRRNFEQFDCIAEEENVDEENYTNWF